MGDVKVKVVIGNIARGASPAESTVYKKGQEFICTEVEAKKLGKDVEILGTIEEPVKETKTPVAQKTASVTAKK